MATSDRPPRPRRARRLAAAAGCVSACLAYAACGVAVDSEEAYRLLDRTCARTLDDGPACQLIDAEQTEGITADTIGFRLGPSGTGALTIHLQALDSIQGPIAGTFDIEILAARTPGAEQGEISAVLDLGCPAPDCPSPATLLLLEDDYAWYPVATGEPRPAAFPYAAALLLTGTNADIADIRTTTLAPAGCTIASSPGLPR